MLKDEYWRKMIFIFEILLILIRNTLDIIYKIQDLGKVEIEFARF